MQKINLGQSGTVNPRRILIAVYASNTLRADCLRLFSCKIIFNARGSNYSFERGVLIFAHIYTMEDGWRRLSKKSIITKPN